MREAPRVTNMATGRFQDVREFAELDSTNRYALDQARLGAPEGLVVVADHQTAGRGRLGRRWESPPRSALLLSVLLRPRLGPEQLYLASAAVALAGAAACRAVTQALVRCKWPNDLVLGDRKLAGVLSEVAPEAAEASKPSAETGEGGGGLQPAVVVGIGINLTWPGPPGAGGISLREATGKDLPRRELQDALLAELDPRRDALDDQKGRARLVDELRSLLATLGQYVRVQQADGDFEGVAVDVTDAGHLVVQTGKRRREVVAGDVIHLRPAGRTQSLH